MEEAMAHQYYNWLFENIVWLQGLEKDERLFLLLAICTLDNYEVLEE